MVTHFFLQKAEHIKIKTANALDPVSKALQHTFGLEPTGWEMLTFYFAKKSMNKNIL